MTNLLPQYERHILRKEQFRRVGVVGCMLVCLVMVISTISLFPSYLLLRGKEQALKEQIDVVRQIAERKEQGDVGLEMRKTQAQLDVLTKEQDEYSLVARFPQVINTLPHGVTLTSLSYAADEEGVGTMVLQGYAPTRDALIAFNENLQAEDYVSESVLPISYLSQNEDITFTLNVDMYMTRTAQEEAGDMAGDGSAPETPSTNEAVL